MSWTLKYKYLSFNWRQILSINDIDICKFLSGAQISIPGFPELGVVTDAVIKEATRATGLTRCPWNVGMKFRQLNLTDPESAESIQVFPSGDYRHNFTFFNDEDNLILELLMFSTLTTGGAYEF